MCGHALHVSCGKHALAADNMVSVTMHNELQHGARCRGWWDVSFLRLPLSKGSKPLCGGVCVAVQHIGSCRGHDARHAPRDCLDKHLLHRV